MADSITIVHSLDLLLRLIDTTTGRLVTTRGVTLTVNGEVAHPMSKSEGSYIFMNGGREDFDLKVTAPGFETRELRVEYEKLEKDLPILELHLIPNMQYQTTDPCFTLSGTLPGIERIDAVKLGDSPCLIRGFDTRKRILTVFNPHHLEMTCVFYAVVNPEEGSYEAFEIKKRLTDQTYKTDRRLEREFANHYPVTRMVFGSTRPDGGYLLRVRNNSSDGRWSVRYTVGGKEAFHTVDFNRPEIPALPTP